MLDRNLKSLARPFRFLVSRKWVLPLLIFVAAVSVNYALLATRSELATESQPERVWPVRTIQASHQDVRPRIHLFGEVVAGRRSVLTAPVDGLIVAVGENFREGGVVKRGELLVQIDPFDYETELSEQQWKLQEAETRLEQLRRDYVRAEDLHKDELVSDEFLDNAELAAAQQEAIVGQRKVSVERAEHELSEARLVAPYDGVVTKAVANLGNHVSGFSDSLAEIIDTSALEVRFTLSNAQYGRLIDGGESAVGRAVEIFWEVGHRKLKYSGTIKRVGAEIVSTTGGVDAFAVLETGGKQTNLRPGAFVAVHLQDMVYKKVLEAPDTALHGEDIVYVVDGGRLSARHIKIHGYSGANIIFSSLAEPRIVDGDLIVVTQLREGGAGIKVKVF